MKAAAARLNFFKNKPMIAKNNSLKIFQALKSEPSQLQTEEINLKQFIVNQNMLNNLFKSFLENNLDTRAQRKTNHTANNKGEFLNISNQTTNKKMKYGKEFKQMLDPRDQILQHDFDFTVKINIPDIRQKGFLKSGTYTEIIENTQEFMV